MARKHKGPVLIDFQVEQEDSVYPMVAAGAALHEMIRRPNPDCGDRDGRVRNLC